MSLAIRIYRLATRLGQPFLGLLLHSRLKNGKEDGSRIAERFGHATINRPEGSIIWLHAASIGESISLLKLINSLANIRPNIQVLLTTGTVTSAALLKNLLPDRTMHQYTPLDTPNIIRCFLAHWQPSLAVFTESELWPNIILECDKGHIPLALINARMSERSFTRWQMLPKMALALLKPFQFIAAQTKADAERYATLGGTNIQLLGNLKHDAEPLSVDASILEVIRKTIGNRPCLVAASLHPIEEEIIIKAAQNLRQRFPELLTIIIPRHPERGAMMKESAKAVSNHVALRSANEPCTPNTEFYVADTIGEMGMWYQLATIVIIGGSFIPHGGQNPLEPARLKCCIITGPHMFNFQEIIDEMKRDNAVIQLSVMMGCSLYADALSDTLNLLLPNKEKRLEMGENAASWLSEKPAVAHIIAEKLCALIKPTPHLEVA